MLKIFCPTPPASWEIRLILLVFRNAHFDPQTSQVFPKIRPLFPSDSHFLEKIPTTPPPPQLRKFRALQWPWPTLSQPSSSRQPICSPPNRITIANISWLLIGGYYFNPYSIKGPRDLRAGNKGHHDVSSLCRRSLEQNFCQLISWRWLFVFTPACKGNQPIRSRLAETMFPISAT